MTGTDTLHLFIKFFKMVKKYCQSPGFIKKDRLSNIKKKFACLFLTRIFTWWLKFVNFILWFVEMNRDNIRIHFCSTHNWNRDGFGNFLLCISYGEGWSVNISQVFVISHFILIITRCELWSKSRTFHNVTH